MTRLGLEIAATIEAEGPMRLDRYMALCLGHPAHGYYATRDPFGAKGDFTTAPEISQMFGELIGLWAAEAWRMMGAPARVALVELGPGRGTLTADLLRAAKVAPGFLAAVEVVLVETSPVLRATQANSLEGADAPVRWAGTIDEAFSKLRHPGRSPRVLPLASPRTGSAQSRDRPQDEAHSNYETPGGNDDEPSLEDDPGSAADAAVRDDAAGCPAIVIANEFFDALPIRQFVRADRGWRERLVGLGPDGRLTFGLSPEAPAGLDLPDAPDGSVREICPEALSIAGRIASHLTAHAGACLAIDYGYAAGGGDTLQALKAHAFADPLDAPGEADLTAHVDFSALAAAAKRGGAAVMQLLPQGEFLERLGVAARAHRLAEHAAGSRQRQAIFAAASRLTDRGPRGMGALFKALAFGDPRLGTLPGFEPASATAL